MRILGMRFCSLLLVLVFGAAFGFCQQSSLSDSSQMPAIFRPPITLEPDASGVIPQAQFRELLRCAQDREVENEKRLRDYTYIEREEEHRLDGSGNVRKTETRTREVLEVYGERVERLIAKDDRPLPAGEAKKEEGKIQKVIDKYNNESESSRRKRLDKEEKERQDERKFVLEIADAFTFRLVGSEVIDGRDTWVIEGEPRTGYAPKERSTKIVSKFNGRVWIDKAELQWVKLDITAIDSISVGWFLARIHKGMHIVAEQTKINEEVWLPKHVAVRVDSRLALVKSYNEDVDETFRNYKKFRTESKITAIGETQ
jgi:hypothetical protein